VAPLPNVALRRFAAVTAASVAWKVAIVVGVLVVIVQYGGGH